MILLLKRAVSFCPFSPGHIPITFPELTFKCTFTTSEDSKPIHLETIPGKLRTKRAYFHLHGLQDCHCQDKMARSARREERWDSPCSSWGPSSSSCHPGICLLRHIFYSETQIQLTVKWNYPFCTIHAGPFKPFNLKLDCLLYFSMNQKLNHFPLVRWRHWRLFT